MMDEDESRAVGGKICRRLEVLEENLSQCHFVHQKPHMA
jgi:hypothetical protein